MVYIGARAQQEREHEAARIAQEEARAKIESMKGGDYTEQEYKRVLQEIVQKTSEEWGVDAGAIQSAIDIQTYEPRTFGGAAQPSVVGVPTDGDVVYKPQRDITEEDIQKIRKEQLPERQRRIVETLEKQKKPVEIGEAGQITVVEEPERKKVITVGGAIADVPETATVYPAALERYTAERRRERARVTPQPTPTPSAIEAFRLKVTGEPYPAIPSVPESVWYKEPTKEELARAPLYEAALKPPREYLERPMKEFLAREMGISKAIPKYSPEYFGGIVKKQIREDKIKFEQVEERLKGARESAKKDYEKIALDLGIVGVAGVGEVYKTVTTPETYKFAAMTVAYPPAGAAYFGLTTFQERKRLLGEISRPESLARLAVGAGAVGFITGVPLRARARIETSVLLKRQLQKDISKLSKYEQDAFWKAMEKTEEVRGVKPPIKLLREIRVERVPSKAMSEIEKIAKTRKDIIGGTVAAKMQVYGAEFKPKDIDIYVKEATGKAAREYAEGLKKMGVERVSVVGDKITVKGKKALEFHEAEAFFFPNIRQVAGIFESGIRKTEEGLKIMKLPIQAKRKLVGAYTDPMRHRKDIKHYREIMRSLFRSKAGRIAIAGEEPKLLKTPQAFQVIRGGRGYPRYPKAKYPRYPKISYPRYKPTYPKYKSVSPIKQYPSLYKPTEYPKYKPLTKPYVPTRPYKPTPQTEYKPTIPYKPTPLTEVKYPSLYKPKVPVPTKYVPLIEKEPFRPTTVRGLPFREKRPMLKTPAFKVLVKRFGKYKLLAKGLPKGKALRAGSEWAKKTLGVTFKLVPFGVTKMKDVPFRPTRFMFREYRKVKGKRIITPLEFRERRKFRLSMKPEVKEIQLWRRTKVKKKKRRR
jgi:hypothetical protein